MGRTVTLARRQITDAYTSISSLVTGVSTSRPTAGDHHHIFDTNAAFFGHINTGLNRDDHARFQPLGLALAQPRRLVNLQTYAMPGRVRKVSVELRFTQYRARRFVDLSCGYPRPDRSNARQLRLEHGLVPRPLKAVDTTHMYGAGHVGTITAQYNTRIDDNESTLTDGSTRRAPMRQGSTLSRCDNGLERHAVGARLRAAYSSFAATSGFGDPGLAATSELPVDLRAELNRSPDQLQFLAHL